MKTRLVLLLALCAGTAGAQGAQTAVQSVDWPSYGRDPGGARHSPLTLITKENVGSLVVAWTYKTGEPTGQPRRGRAPALEVTPIVVDGTMYIITPHGRIAALDPATGTERWRYEAKVNRDAGFGDFASRGVAFWRDRRAAKGAVCATRIFAASIDARLMAIDAATGKPCMTFGYNGGVDLRSWLRIPPFEFPAYEHTSPPAIIGDLVITGSGIGDNSRPDPASGEVRAWDARTGKLKWTFDPIPQDPSDPASKTWKDSSAAKTGAANAWSVIATDPANDLVFVPTSSPAPDYVGTLRLGDNRYANSIVALRGSTGKVVWHFQTVHHDLWDYDNASPPALVDVTKDGKKIPAVLQGTKTGMLFVLNRLTGEPIFGVEERPVPKSDVPGEVASAMQPFTSVTPPLVPHRVDPATDAWGLNDAKRDACRAIIEGFRNEGIFTPPSAKGTLAVPGNVGGAHWGGVATDASRAIAVVPVNRVPAMVQLIPESSDIAAMRTESGRLGLDYEYTRMQGTGYWMRRRFIRGADGLPCTKPPWGALVGVSLTTGKILWDVPLGAWPNSVVGSGTINLGGPISTASGLVFIGATIDRQFRAFDIESGRELWATTLPAGARATPMTYQAGGRQFVVVAAGGSDVFGAGDVIVAFALPKR